MWFRKQRDTLWDRLAKTLGSGDTRAFIDLCAREADAIVREFPAWQKGPPDLPDEEQQAYIHVLFTIARVFDEVLGDPGIMEQLTGGENNAFRRWNEALLQAETLLESGAHREAVELLESVLAEMDRSSGTGVDHLRGMVYGRLGECYAASGDLAGALRYTDEALRHCGAHGDGEGVLTYLGNRAFHLRQADRFSEAAATLEELARTLSMPGALTLPGDSARHAFLGCRLALDLPDAELAAQLCELGFALSDDASTGETDALSIEMNNAAEDLRLAGEVNAARRLLEVAIELRRRTVGEDFALGRFLGNLGYLGLQARERDLVAVEATLKESLIILERTLDVEPAAVAEALHNLGAFYHTYMQDDRAREFYKRSLDLKGTYLPRDDPAYRATYANLARLELADGADESAKPLLEALHAQHEPARGLDEATRLEWANLLDIYIHMGNVADAEPLAIALLEDGIARGRRSFEHAAGLVKLAEVRGEQNRIAEAERLFLEAIGMLREHPNQRPGLSAALNNFGMLLNDQGEHERAREVLRESLAIKESDIGREHSDWATTANNLAIAESRTGDKRLAYELLVEVLEVRRRTSRPGSRLLAQSLLNAGHFLLETGEVAAGLPYIEEWADEIVAARTSALAVASEAERLAYLRQVREELDELSQVMYRVHGSHPGVVPVFFDIVLKLKGIGLDALVMQRARLQDEARAELADAAGELRNLRERIAHLMLWGKTDDDTPELREALARRRRLEVVLAAALPASELTSVLRRTDRESVAAALPPDSALLEFYRYELGAAGVRERVPAYLAFVLPAGEPENVALVTLGLADDVEYAVEVIRRGMVVPEVPLFREEMVRLGRIVTDRLLDHAGPQLRGRRRLVVAPDGILNRVPLELFHTSGGGLLGDTYEITYVNTGRDLLTVNDRAPVHAPIVVGDPDYDLGAVEAERGPKPFKRLLGTAAEALRVSDLLGTAPWMGPDALESRVKVVRSPSILHLATHGFSVSSPDEVGASRVREAARGRGPSPQALDLENLDNPLLSSGLALAGANTWMTGGTPPAEAEDGLLLGEDVLSLDLRGTELVVLSACETGLGRYEPGEGIFGLRRAFTLAGARSLLVSLWSVPDEATTELMVAFYEALVAGESRIVALRNAQRKVRAVFEDPFYWGGFILIGDANPLRIPSVAARPGPAATA